MKGMLGRYELLGELGRGSMGTVFRAVDPLIGREVAIKTLHRHLPEDVAQEVRERFLREARSAGRLSHPGIVTVYDVGEHEGVAYIAMELLPGRSLQQILRAGRPPVDTAVDLAAQIADALDHAHELSVVHRDVKPANVVVAASGRCKLTDFGVAHLATSTMTQTGAALGTPRYMSPEQALGQRAEARSDIFSLGIVLYEMLAGRTPFERAEDASPYVLLNRIASEPHAPLRSVDARLPAALERVVDRALAKDPERRYRRASDMAAELRGYRTLETARPDAAAVPDRLIEDIDAFARRWDEEETRRKAAEEAQRQAEEKERLRLEDEAKRAAAARAAAAGAPGDSRWKALGGRTGALEILKKQAAAQPAPREASAPKGDRQLAFAQAIQAGFHYLAELVNQLNSLKPLSALPYEHLYLGRLPKVRLSGARIDSRPTHVPGHDVCGLIMFRYGVTPETPASATLLGADVERCQGYLKSLKVPFELRTLAKNDFGQPTRATVLTPGPLPCEVNIRADYEALAADFELLNVRRLGRLRLRLQCEQVGAAIDDLARFVLGADDEFARYPR